MSDTLDRSKQKFLRGDTVKLRDDFPSEMAHFEGRGEQAIVVGSYADRYPSINDTNRRIFTLFFPTIEGRPYNGSTSWYDEELLTLVSPVSKEQLDILDKADQAEAARPPEPVRTGSRYGVPTVSSPSDPKALYVRCMYHTFWWGPFAGEAEVADALKKLDTAEPMWDYDCFAIHYGVANLKDAVNDPVYVSHAARERIEELRRPGHKEGELYT